MGRTISVIFLAMVLVIGSLMATSCDSSEVIKADYDQLQQRLDSLQSDLNKAVDQLKTLQSDYDTTKKQLDDAKTQITNLQGQIQTLQSERDTAKTQLQSTQDKLTQAETELGGTLYSLSLMSFFDGFDTNQDDVLSVAEAEAFYQWVEDNVKYRYDNEALQNASPGDLVGDGRTGADYRQTPYETWIDKAGDCEDMATLEAAFYEHWGVEAYVGLVNSQPQGAVDHAVCLVLWPESLLDALGPNVVYWEFLPGEALPTNYGIVTFSPGTYLLVDNSFSDTFGELNDTLQPGQFTLQAIMVVIGPYRDEYMDFVAPFV